MFSFNKQIMWDCVDVGSGSEWFVTLAPIAYLGSAWCAKRREQWLRVVLFTANAYAGVVYHWHKDVGCGWEWMDHAEDLSTILWLLNVATLTLLEAPWPKLLELGPEALMTILSVLAWIYLDPFKEGDWWTPLVVWGVALSMNAVMWLKGKVVHVPEEFSITRGVGWFCIMCAVVLSITNQQLSERKTEIHATFHLLVALGEALLVYALRNEDYAKSTGSTFYTPMPLNM